MINKFYDVKIDFNKPTQIPIMRFVQHDTKASGFKFTIENISDLDVGHSLQIIFTGEYFDPVYDLATITSGSTAEYILKSDVLSQEGYYKALVSLIGSSDERLTSTVALSFEVISSPDPDLLPVESDDRMPVLTELISSINELDQVLKSNDSLRASAEASRVIAESNRNNAENQRISNEVYRQASEDDRKVEFDQIKTQFEAMSTEQTSNAEVIAARMDSDGVQHNSLKAHLDTWESKVTDLADKLSKEQSKPVVVTDITTVDDAYGGPVDVTVYGETINNLASNGENYDNWYISGVGTTKGATGIHLVADAGSEKASLVTRHKPSTLYSVIYKVNASTINDSGAFYLAGNGVANTDYILDKTIGIHVKEYTTDSIITVDTVDFRLNTGTTDGLHIDFEVFGVIEGYISNIKITEPLDYGLNSLKNPKIKQHGVNYIPSDEFTNGLKDTLPYYPPTPNTTYVSIPDFIKVEAGTYKLSKTTTEGLNFKVRDNEGNEIKFAAVPFDFTVTKDSELYIFGRKATGIWNLGAKPEDIGLMLTKIDITPTEYISYSPSQLSIENVTLRKWDKLKQIGGVNTIEIGSSEEITFDGSGDEDWALFSAVNQINTIAFQVTVNDGVKGISNDIVCVKSDYAVDITASQLYANDAEGISLPSNNKPTLRVLRSELVTEDIAGLRNWLASNPITAIFTLAQPIEIKEYEFIDNGITITGDGIIATAANQPNTFMASSDKFNPRVEIKYDLNIFTTVDSIKDVLSETRKLVSFLLQVQDQQDALLLDHENRLSLIEGA